MKILVAGDWHSQLHEEPVCQALEQLGQDVVGFPWHQYFESKGALEALAIPALKFQNKYMVGPSVSRLNRDLVACVASEKPDVIFVYRGSHIYPKTLKNIRHINSRTVLVGYNNDDPFSPLYPWWKWRHFLAGITEYDLVLAYRLHNLEDFRKAGARRVKLLPPWFVPSKNHPEELNEEDKKRFSCDVVFAGHYEADGRLKCLEEIVKRGLKLNLFGHDYGWHPTLKRSEILRHLIPVTTVWGEDYNKALCGAKVALCFLSKLNRDTYTRRCFEIPATGTLMLSEYTPELAQLFRPGIEADFFSSPEELAEKIDFYLTKDEIRKQVATAGRKRVISDGHDVASRMKHVLSLVEELQ